MAKCNLGKVNLEAILVSSFPTYTRGGLMPLAGAPRDLYTQLLACSSSQSAVAVGDKNSLLRIHVIVAARAVAFSSPTPYPFNIAWVARVPVIDEQNAWIE